MNAITTKIGRLAPLARNLLCARRSASLRPGKSFNSLLKSGNTKILNPTTSFIQCRFQSSSRSDNVHQTALIHEWNDIGHNLIQQQRWTEALEAANKVLKIDANNHRALLIKSIACYNLKQYQAALDGIDILLAHGAASGKNYLIRCLIRCHFDQYDGALEDIKQSRKLGEEHTNFWPQLCTDIDKFGPKSIEILRRALKDFSSESTLHYALAYWHLRNRKYSEAKEFIQRAVEMDPNNGLYLMTFGGIELNLKNLQHAAQLLDKCIELGFTHREEVWNWRIGAAYQMGNYDDVEKYYYKAFERIKPNEVLLNNAMNFVCELHDTYNEPERAIKLAEKVISFGDKELTPRAERILAEMLVASNRPNDAAKIYRKLHESNPNDTDVTFNYARLLEPKEALPYFEELSRTRADDVTWEVLGHTYLKLSQHEKSLDAFNKATALKETMSRRMNLAGIYAHLQQHQKEHQTLVRVCELSATDKREGIRYFAALPLVARWQHNKALQELNEFLTKNPSEYNAWNALANVLKELGRETEALEAIGKAMNIDPSVAGYLQKVDVLAHFGRFDETREVLKHAETILDQYEIYRPLYHFTVGIMLHKQGRYEEALEHIDKYINGTPPADLFVYQRWVEKAKALEALQRTDEAIANYEYVLSIFPEEPHSLLHLAKLYHSCGLNSKALALVPRLAALHTDIDSFNNEVAEFLALIK